MESLTSREAAERLSITLKVLHGLRAHGRIRYLAITERKILYHPRIAMRGSQMAQRGTGKVTSNGIVPFSQRRDQAQTLPSAEGVTRTSGHIYPRFIYRPEARAL